jgi:hypothetical protein
VIAITEKNLRALRGWVAYTIYNDKETDMFKILKSITYLLENDAGVSSIVGNKIFPNVAPDKGLTGKPIDFPMIVMRRSAMIPTQGKDCSISSTEVEIYCYSVSYDEAIDLAEKVYNCLNGVKGDVAGIQIGKINFSSAEEAYVETAFAQKLVFTIK